MNYMGRLCLIVMLIWLASGCAHQVAFQDVDYRINEQPREEPLLVVISEAERSRVVPVRAVMTGAAHSWDAEPGTMLVQIAEVELPQMFNELRMVERNNGDPRWLVLRMSVPDYRFEQFRAFVTIHANLQDIDGQELLDQLYQAEGPSKGGRMFWGGAFAMKSAMRTSSVEAFKQIFAELRRDLNQVLDDRPPGTHDASEARP